LGIIAESAETISLKLKYQIGIEDEYQQLGLILLQLELLLLEWNNGAEEVNDFGPIRMKIVEFS